MSPARKSRSVNKRYSCVNEVSPNKDGDSSKRSNQRKRKLSMLGPQWNKEELGRFYDAYRKYGKDWKKVAAAVRNRSVDMVEALYTMNRAYLSLPEGTASVVGLIAMMTDHYCNLAGSDSEQESNEGAGTSQKPQKRARGKVQAGTSKGSDLQTPTVAPNYGCLSLLKKKRSGGTRPRVVGKRTPRFPVSYSYENFNSGKYFSSSRQGLKRKLDANDDEVAHEIALALAEASLRGGSPQVSQTPTRRTDSALSTPARNAEKKHVNLEMANSKLLSSEMDEDEGSMEADTGEVSRNRTLLETGRTMQKGRRLSGRKLEIDDTGDNHFDDIKEACSGTEEGYRLGAVKGKHDQEVAGERVSRASSLGLRKRSKKVLFQRDESSAFDALQTLADLSLMMPATENENDLMMQVKDENDHIDESGTLEALPTNRQREKRGSSGVKTKWSQPASRLEVASSTMSKHGKASVDTSSVPETKQTKKTQKILTSKARKAEAHLTNDISEPQDFETKDAPKKPSGKGKRSLQSSSPKLIKNQDHSSSADLRIERSDSAQSIAEVPVANQVTLPTKVRSRRKMGIKKPQKEKDLTFPDSILDNNCNLPFASVNDKLFNLKKKLSSCLSNDRVRRWCIYEWFYSAIDYPWFAKREFVEYLYHVGLGHVPRLTRVEWDVIRSSLGKPRRFSEQFLKEEKEKLSQYREFVRTHYTELREGTREGLPTDLARPICVGQRVIAIHPKTREVHDGSVLTVDYSRCRVQFDRPELGVEFVNDIDCMPLNPNENMPALLRRNGHAVDKLYENFNEHKVNEQANDSVKYASRDNLENGDGFPCLPSSTYAKNNLLMQTEVDSANVDGHAKIGSSETAQQMSHSQPGTVGQNQAKEADVQALAKLTRALDKKEAVISELRRMNDDVLENQKSGDCTLKDSEPFKKQYAAVIVQLNEVNEQVSSALYCLRQRNTYQGSISLNWPRPVANFGDSGGIVSTFDCYTNQTQEPGSHINEIIESSKIKARTMVDAAVQAMSSLNGVENSTGDVEDAIDYLNDRIPLDESCLLTIPDSKLKNPVHGNEADIPSELITQCVATLLMIQKCTERQFPPADVAKILDSAVASLQPSCSHNLPLYAEIEKCMGIIRTQILALIPT
nr:protein ALWAYS EARLY 3-like [Ipomoea batatas]